MTVSGEPNYSIHTLIGKRDSPLLTVYVRQLIELVGTTSSKPIVVSLALINDGDDSGNNNDDDATNNNNNNNNSNKSTFQAIMEIIHKNKVW